MKTLLDEILSPELPAGSHAPGKCGCPACAHKPTDHTFLTHWRARRRQRLGLFEQHPAQCNCSACSSKQPEEQEYSSNHAHTYWRRRRNIRHGWPVNAEMEELEVVQPQQYSPVLNPLTTFFGQSPQQVLRKKPRNWRVIPAINRHGWKMIDEKGNERIRFMRPDPRRKGTWEHIKTGYWVIRDGRGNYLDDYGRIVAPNISFGNMTEEQKNKIHVVFTGQMREL